MPPYKLLIFCADRTKPILASQSVVGAGVGEEAEASTIDMEKIMAIKKTLMNSVNSLKRNLELCLARISSI